MPITKADLIVELFPQCNLHCDFCMQTKLDVYSKVREQTIQFSKEYYIKKCLEVIKKNNLKHDTIALWGGELFYDNSIKYTFAMIKFLEELRPKHCSMHTNLIFNTENEFFQYFIKHMFDWTLEISYDPIGRFKNKKTEDIFKKNLDYILKYIEDKDSNKKIPVYTVLQPEVLYQSCDFSLLEYISKISHLEQVFVFDYRAPIYIDKFLDDFNENYLNLLKRFPKCQNVRILSTPHKVYPNNLCRCIQKSSQFITYNTMFAIQKDSGCVVYEGACESARKMEKAYECNSCRYKDTCTDVCSSIMEKLGFFKQGRSCYQKYAYEHLFDNQGNLLI